MFSRDWWMYKGKDTHTYIYTHTYTYSRHIRSHTILALYEKRMPKNKWTTLSKCLLACIATCCYLVYISICARLLHQSQFDYSCHSSSHRGNFWTCSGDTLFDFPCYIAKSKEILQVGSIHQTGKWINFWQYCKKTGISFLFILFCTVEREFHTMRG